jgi:hypothetical protein
LEYWEDAELRKFSSNSSAPWIVREYCPTSISNDDLLDAAGREIIEWILQIICKLFDVGVGKDPTIAGDANLEEGECRIPLRTQPAISCTQGIMLAPYTHHKCRNKPGMLPGHFTS